jgi:hypothetical protein
MFLQDTVWPQHTGTTQGEVWFCRYFAYSPSYFKLLLVSCTSTHDFARSRLPSNLESEVGQVLLSPARNCIWTFPFKYFTV